MNFFGMGPMEMMVILVVALVIFGPGKLPEIAQMVGKGIREFKAATGDLTGEFQRTINDVTSEVTAVTDDVKKSAADVQQTAQSAISGVDGHGQGHGNGLLMDQAATPASAPARPIPPAPQSSYANSNGSSPRMPTKEDPLADLMSFERPSQPTGGTNGADGSHR